MVTNLLLESSKFTLPDFSVKVGLGPSNTFPFLVGTQVLLVEGTGETLREGTVLLSGSGVFTEQAPAAPSLPQCSSSSCLSSTSNLRALYFKQ